MNPNQQWDKAKISEIIQSLSTMEGALLPILHAIQQAQGYIPKDSVPMIAHALNRTAAEIHGVISFYDDFRLSPVGKHLIQICRAEACQARGARQLEEYAKTALKVDFHGTTLDGEFTLKPVYCLGNCACGPSVRVNDEVIADVSPKRFDQLIDTLTTTVIELSE